MLRIFQRFDLDIEAFDKIIEKLKNTNLPCAVRRLQEDLVQKGYRYFESNEDYNGCPLSILLEGEGTNHKRDFYRLTNELRLPYHSDSFYVSRETKEKKS